ncbi:MAG: hypothetical protein LBU62_10260 [Bacteroidales bacterium]|jgi:hypothetical protein|nr:hypothetical protein [Bacteroidales bacterium]
MKGIYLFWVPVFFVSCEETPPPPQAFYYWRTVYRINATERQALTENGAERLYIRYFDVTASGDGYKPEATALFRDSLPKGMKAVPVVFIVNDVLATMPEDSIGGLAKRICSRIEQMNRQYGITNVPEIQLDCDWNGSTRDKYFRLLQLVKDAPLLNGRQLSVTLRLHQWRYSKTTGVPPVNKVCLMCYNMGHLTTYGNRNSILNAEETRAYLSDAGIYPLPVDVAFPIFSWGVLFSNQQYRRLINRLGKTDLTEPFFTEIAPDMYRADSATVLRGAYIRKGDHIRLEEPTIADIRKAAKILSAKIKNPEYIIWFHLDSLYLQKINTHERSQITDLFR